MAEPKANKPMLYDKSILAAVREKLIYLFRQAPEKINIKLIAIESNTRIGMPDINNQIIVLLRNGEWIVFPRQLTAKAVDEALGAKRRLVRFWGVLPSNRSQANPCQINPDGVEKTEDLYDITHDRTGN